MFALLRNCQTPVLQYIHWAHPRLNEKYDRADCSVSLALLCSTLIPIFLNIIKMRD